MSKSVPKIALSSSRDIPFKRLVLSQANVRRIKAGVSIEELAEDIARRTLLQSLTVRAILDDKGAETGMFEVPAGGRRFRALELLVKQKRLARNALIPCVVRTEGLPEEDSLAENIQRAPLHPLDQFRACRESTTNFQTFPDSSQVSAPLRCQRQNRPILQLPPRQATEAKRLGSLFLRRKVAMVGCVSRMCFARSTPFRPGI